MTDRELLELAAKAAGFGGEHGTTWTESEYPRGSGKNGALWNYVGHGDTAKLWNPLEDDGDALRLAVRLRMNIEVTDRETFACSFGNHAENHGNDQMAATRRAIVRAAAEIGKRGA